MAQPINIFKAEWTSAWVMLLCYLAVIVGSLMLGTILRRSYVENLVFTPSGEIMVIEK